MTVEPRPWTRTDERSGPRTDLRAVRLRPGVLESVDVYITGLCNRRCEYCFLPKKFLDNAQHMSTAEYRSILTWAHAHDIPEITVLGGEASLHPHFVEFVQTAADKGLKVRIVTNGHPRFRAAIENGTLNTKNVSRVAVSLDTSSDSLQDILRGRRATKDATAAILALKHAGIPFDVNVTGLKSVMADIRQHVAMMCDLGARRVNIHWPSQIGVGAGLAESDIPSEQSWAAVVDWVGQYQAPRSDFFVEIERGYLRAGERLNRCAIDDMDNLQVFPGGTAYRCGLLVDRPHMSTLSLTNGELTMPHTGRPRGEQALSGAIEGGCDGCPLAVKGSRRACIYDKVASELVLA